MPGMDHRMFKLGLCPQEHIPMALDIAPKPLGIVTVEIQGRDQPSLQVAYHGLWSNITAQVAMSVPHRTVATMTIDRVRLSMIFISPIRNTLAFFSFYLTIYENCGMK